MPDIPSPILERLVVRPFAESDSIPDLTVLLHRAYKALADMGLRFFATHQTEEQTRSRLRDGHPLVGVLDGRIVATITYYPTSHSGGTPWYERDDVAYFGQFAVEPELQREGIGRLLMEKVETMAREEGAAEIALDTAEGATHLIEYYGRRGYRFIEFVQWNVTNYRSVILSKSLYTRD